MSSPPPPIRDPRYRFRRGALQPPGIFVTDDDVFQLRVDVASTVGRRYQVEGRIRVLDARLEMADYRLPADFTGTNTVIVQRPAARGFIQGAMVSRLGDFADLDPTLTPPGEMFAQLTVGRFLASGGYEHTVLCAGYVTARSAIGWPGGKSEQPGDGIGWITHTGPLGGGGVGFTIGYASADYVELLQAGVILTSNPIGPAKAIRLVLVDPAGVNTMVSIASPNIHAAGATVQYTWGQGLPYQTGADTRQTLPLPVRCFMEPRTLARIETAPAFGAVDLYANGYFVVRRWAP